MLIEKNAKSFETHFKLLFVKMYYGHFLLGISKLFKEVLVINNSFRAIQYNNKFVFIY
jgi:hypothetical protein